MHRSIGVVEDDSVLRRSIERGLSGEGFTIAWSVGTAAEAMVAVATSPDALVVDLGLPDADGLDLILALRSREVSSRIIALTARTSSADVLLGFEAGVDDYVGKPFVFAELVARLDALVRRDSKGAPKSEVLLDPLTHSLHVEGDNRVLTPTEYRLLASLLVRRDRVQRRAALKLAGWPAGAFVTDNTLDSYIARLRSHVRSLGASWQIETVRGVGYRITSCG